MSNTPPLGWKVSSFDQVFSEIKNGCSIDQNTSGDGIPVTRIETISQEKIDYSKVGWVKTTDDIDRFQIEKHDILLSHINSLKHIGKTAIKEDDRRLYHGMNLLRLKVCKSSFYPVYIHNLLSWEVVREEMRRKAKQAINQASLNVQDIKSLTYALPPLPEQQKIATILSSVDDVIEKTRAQIDKLKDLKTGMMQELLTKGIGHTEFKDSPVGLIPAAWKIARLGDIVLPKGIQTGPFGSQLHSHEYIEWGVPVIMPRDMKGNKIDPASVAHIPLGKAAELDKHRVEIGDLVFARRGDIGRFALVDKSNEGWVCGTGCLKVRLQSSVSPAFIASYLTLAPVIEWLNTNAVGQTMLNLNTSILSELPIILPPEHEQAVIGEAILSLDNKVALSSDKLDGLLRAKKALMQDLLTGKVRVNLTDKESAVV